MKKTNVSPEDQERIDRVALAVNELPLAYAKRLMKMKHRTVDDRAIVAELLGVSSMDLTRFFILASPKRKFAYGELAIGAWEVLFNESVDFVW